MLAVSDIVVICRKGLPVRNMAGCVATLSVPLQIAWPKLAMAEEMFCPIVFCQGVNSSLIENDLWRALDGL